MGDFPVGFACYICVTLGFFTFYLVALIQSPEVSEISCAEVMWYTMCIGTGFGIFSCLYQIYKRKQLQELQKQLQEMQKSNEMSLDLDSPFSALEMSLQCLVSIGMLVNYSLLLDQVLNIDSECKAELDKYDIFWVAAQMQAYLFLTAMSIFGFICCCCGCCAMLLGAKE